MALASRIARSVLIAATALGVLATPASAGFSTDGGRLVDSGNREIGLAAGDFNEDGWDDILTANSNGTTDLLLNRTDNWFFMSAGFPKSAPGSNQNLVVDDFDDDGNLDAVIASSSTDTVSSFLGNGAGGLEVVDDYATGTHPFDIASGDFNEDGDRDIVTANQSNTVPVSAPTVSVLLGAGDGSFTEPATRDYTTGDAGALSRGVAVGDVSGDGNEDIVVANTNGNYVRILLGTGTGLFAGAPTTYATTNGPRKVALADFDGDGDLDIATADSGDGVPAIPANRNNKSTILLNNGFGTFTAAPGSPITTGASQSAPFAIATPDINGDDYPDIVTANRYGGTLSVVLGNGDGTFGTYISRPYPEEFTSAEVTDLAVGNVNGDARPDIVGNAAGSPGFLVPFLNTTTIDPPALNATSPASPANDTTPLVIGTSQDTSIVRLYTTSDCSGSPLGSGSAAAFASPGIEATVPANAATTIYATAENAAGWSTSACSSTSITYTDDSIPPSAPTGLATSPVSPANDTTPAVTGTAESGSTVTLYSTADCTGGAIGTGTSAAFASPGIDATVAANATTAIRVTATDAAGNVSPCSSAVSYTDDSTPPPVPSSLTTSPVSPANDTTPTVTGTAEAGSTVRLYSTTDCSGSPLATGTAAAFASPGIETTVSANDTTALRATATDAAGNASPCSSAVSYTEDSTAPPAPSSLATSPVSPANDTTLSVTGAAESGSTIRLYSTSDCSGSALATGTAAAFASPGIDLTVSANTTTAIRATATDAVGNASSCSSAVSYTEDSTAPSAPSGVATNPASPANDTTPSVTGAAEAGSTVRLYSTSDCSGSPLATGTAAAFSSPGFGVTVSANDTTAIRATATDAASNVSPCSSAASYTEDSTAPSAPSGLATLPVSSGSDTTPSVTGAAEAGSTVKLYATSDCSGSPLATGTAAGFASPGIEVTVTANDTTAIRATATDAANNVSPCSSAVSYTEDSIAPSAPTGLATSPVSPATDTTPTVTGTADSGTTVKLYATADCSGSPLATGAAAALASPGIDVTVPANATTAIRATATDAVGNTSACSAPVSYTDDSAAPAAPTALATSPVSPAPNTTPAVTGIAEAGSTVKIYASADCSGSPLAVGLAVDFTSSGLEVTVAANSTTALRATATDAVGNTSACSAPVSYTDDSVVPSAPTALVTAPASPAGDTTPFVTGSAEAESTVRLFTTADCSGSALATGSAAAFASPGLEVTVVAGSTTAIRATATDAAGNVSPCSDAVSYVHSTPLPDPGPSDPGPGPTPTPDPGGTPDPGPGLNPNPGAVLPPPPANTFSFGVKATKDSKKRRFVTVTLTLPGPGVVTLRALTTANKPLSSRTRVTIAKAGKKTVKLTLNGTATKLLKRSKRVSAKLQVAYLPTGGTEREQTRSFAITR